MNILNKILSIFKEKTIDKTNLRKRNFNDEPIKNMKVNTKVPNEKIDKVFDEINAYIDEFENLFKRKRK